MDLNNRLNINVAGNIRGNVGGVPNSSVSNQGLGKWEMNPAKLVDPADPQAAQKIAEWAQLITGVTTPKAISGRYGSAGGPGATPFPLWAPGPDAGTPPLAGLFPHFDL